MLTIRRQVDCKLTASHGVLLTRHRSIYYHSFGTTDVGGTLRGKILAPCPKELAVDVGSRKRALL